MRWGGQQRGMQTSQKLTLFGGPSETDNMKPLNLWCALAHGGCYAGRGRRSHWMGRYAGALKPAASPKRLPDRVRPHQLAGAVKLPRCGRTALSSVQLPSLGSFAIINGVQQQDVTPTLTCPRGLLESFAARLARTQL